MLIGSSPLIKYNDSCCSKFSYIDIFIATHFVDNPAIIGLARQDVLFQTGDSI